MGCSDGVFEARYVDHGDWAVLIGPAEGITAREYGGRGAGRGRDAAPEVPAVERVRGELFN